MNFCEKEEERGGRGGGGGGTKTDGERQTDRQEGWVHLAAVTREGQTALIQTKIAEAEHRKGV